MANDRNDFAPEIRNSAWWASDTRQAVNGKAVEVILTKQGTIPPVDLSDVEAVQMGHVMQPVIGRLVSQRLKMEIKDADYSLTHSKHHWFRSHFDFISADGESLIEVKNYSAGVRNKFDTDANRIPTVDYAQLVHEAAVHNLSHIYLAVLFGGQELQTFEFNITDQEKDELIQQMAVFWGHVQSGTQPPAESVEQTKLLYPVSTENVIMASMNMEKGIQHLKQMKEQIKQMEAQAEEVETYLRDQMKDASEIRSVSGDVLVTWRSSKPSKRFNATLFQSAMPDIYEQFVVEQVGSRRFLIK
jgi:predicted phage-related endonuclease